MTIWDFLNNLIKSQDGFTIFLIFIVIAVMICFIFKYICEAIAAFGNRK